MGTRGAYGFRIEGQDKIQYNHYDSYPDGLGNDVVKFIVETPDDELKAIAKKIRLVNEDSTPTAEDIARLIKHWDKDVSTGRTTEWYSLLRNAQGDLSQFKKGLDVMIDNQTFMKDSLFCEYAYIINLDTGNLEFYTGFRKSPGAGRYIGEKSDSGYYGVSLAAEIPLETVRTVGGISPADIFPEEQE